MPTMQILFVRQEFPQALELFEKLAAKHAEDKDTQAYVALLKAMLKQQLTSFDKLREIAPGFQYEVSFHNCWYDELMIILCLTALQF